MRRSFRDLVSFSTSLSIGMKLQVDSNINDYQIIKRAASGMGS